MSWESATILLAGIGTLAIFSFLIKENALYRLFEHLFIGIAAGFGIVYTVKNFLWPQVFVPLFGLDIVRYPDGSFSGEYDLWNLAYLLPMSFGLLFYTIYSKRHAWMAKLVIGFTLGASGGMAFEGFFNEMLPQVVGSFKPLVVFNEGAFDAWASFENCFFVLTLLTVLYYFFFSFKREGAVAQRASSLGRWLLMLCFGAFFGSTVLARLALLVERLQFLYGPWASEWARLLGR
jgi:hypothetical protein